MLFSENINIFNRSART